MSLVRKTVAIIFSLALLAATLLTWYLETYDDREPSHLAYGATAPIATVPTLKGPAAAPH